LELLLSKNRLLKQAAAERRTERDKYQALLGVVAEQEQQK
jgi:hypothetical protein